ncbi:helix-turn-helix domain-containing protein [Maricaulis sp. MIT060901]|uniref:helix-turn-helix domain-containing protein n=1 Tax=Maricaulis sp. MIT060901 TaxID=3096993 RepID=UPI00399C3D3A
MPDGESWTFQNEHRLRGYVAHEFGPGEILRCWSHAVANDAPHYVLPNAEINIVARYSGRYSRVEIFGMATEARWFQPVAGETLLAVTLSPERAMALGLHPRDWTDRFDDAPDALQDRLAPLADRLIGQSEAFARHHWLDAINRLSRERENTFAAFSQSHIRASQGQVSLAGLARRMQVSERQLQRRFHDMLGLTPKRYAQQIRLAETIALADANTSPAWADLAAANGYCDQSHLIRDCKKLTGVSPARLHTLRTASEKSNTPATA